MFTRAACRDSLLDHVEHCERVGGKVYVRLRMNQFQTDGLGWQVMLRLALSCHAGSKIS